MTNCQTFVTIIVMTRDKRVTIRLSLEEYNNLKSKTTTKVSSYIRELATSGTPIYWNDKLIYRGLPKTLTTDLLKHKDYSALLDDGTIIAKENTTNTYFFLKEGDIGYNILYERTS